MRNTYLRRSQRPQAVAAVHPRAHRAERHAKPEISADPRGAEFDLVHHGVDAFAGEPIFRDFMKRLFDFPFHGWHVLRGDPLEANRERGFSARTTVAGARREPRPQA